MIPRSYAIVYRSLSMIELCYCPNCNARLHDTPVDAKSTAGLLVYRDTTTRYRQSCRKLHTTSTPPILVAPPGITTPSTPHSSSIHFLGSVRALSFSPRRLIAVVPQKQKGLLRLQLYKISSLVISMIDRPTDTRMKKAH